MSLADLFPDEDYQFRFRLERGVPKQFFRPTSRHASLVAERKHWLQANPARYAALLPPGEPLLEETIRLAEAVEVNPIDPIAKGALSQSPWSQCLALGRAWEPDFLLLKLDSENSLRLLGGCVCFPSSWSLEEKIGRPLEAIHAVVPGLNQALGPPIHTFVSKLKPDVAWMRSNWGLSRSSELNQHPMRHLPRLDHDPRLEETWLRTEHQALVALPESNGVLFGIRIAMHRLSDLCREASFGSRVARALRTMPEPLARYKGVAEARGKLVALLEGIEER